MGEPSKMQRQVVHLNAIKPQAWKNYEKAMTRACGDNKEQLECVLSLANVVDEKFLLRLETKGAELRAFLAVKNYRTLDREDLDVNQRPEFVEIPEEDVVELAKAMAESISDLVANGRELARIWSTSKTYADAFNRQSELANRKGTNVPVKMTSGWHIHRIIALATTQAMTEFNVVKHAWSIDACTQEYIDRATADPTDAKYLNEEVIAAMRSERITDEDFNTRVARGDILSLRRRNPYARYMELVDIYIANNGKLTRDLQDEFEAQ